MGSAWRFPPPSGRAYTEVTTRRVTTSESAAHVFHQTYTCSPWVWKDPRTATLLPFWRRALGGAVAVVVIHRDPVDVARSLELRNGFSVPFGMALWERYNRLILEHCGGLPVLVVRYDNLVADPEWWAVTAESFLTGLGMPVRADAAARIRTFVEPGLQHSRNGRAADPSFGRSETRVVDGATPLTSGVEKVAAALDVLDGVNPSFVPPRIDTEGPEVEVRLSTRWPDRPPVWNPVPW
jgi:hypothetical protein